MSVFLAGKIYNIILLVQCSVWHVITSHDKGKNIAQIILNHNKMLAMLSILLFFYYVYYCFFICLLLFYYVYYCFIMFWAMPHHLITSIILMPHVVIYNSYHF